MLRYQDPNGKGKLSAFLQYHDWPIEHQHDYWEYFLVIDGAILHKINGKTRTVEKNTLCLIRPDDAHSMHNFPDKTSIHVALRVSTDYFKAYLDVFDPELYEKLLHAQEPLEFPLKTSTANRITDSVYKTFLCGETDEKNAALGILFLDVFRATYYQLVKRDKIPRQYGKITSQLLHAIGNPENLKKTIGDLIREMNYSYSHVNRVFTQETGVSPSKYLKQQKMNYAKQLLTETNLDLQNVALSVGYTSYAHFLVAFQKEVRLSPLEFRKNQSLYLLSHVDV